LHAYDLAASGCRPLHLAIGQHAFVALAAEGIKRGNIGTNALHRRLLQVALGDLVHPTCVVPSSLASQVTIEFAPLTSHRGRPSPISFDQPTLLRELHTRFDGHVLTPGIQLPLRVHGRSVQDMGAPSSYTFDTTLVLTVLVLGHDHERRAMLAASTAVTLQPAMESTTVPAMLLHNDTARKDDGHQHPFEPDHEPPQAANVAREVAPWQHEPSGTEAVWGAAASWAEVARRHTSVTVACASWGVGVLTGLLLARRWHDR